MLPGSVSLAASPQQRRGAAATAAAARSFAPSSSCCPAPRPAQRPSRDLRAAAAPSHKSYDADDDLDADLAEELAKFKSPETWSKMAQHLDLVWKIGRDRGKRQVCACCQGSGNSECKWCHGTGAMMVGDTLFHGKDGGSHCPVCKGKGELPCEHCRGTGHLARWMQGPESGTCRT